MTSMIAPERNMFLSGALVGVIGRAQAILIPLAIALKLHHEKIF